MSHNGTTYLTIQFLLEDQRQLSGTVIIFYFLYRMELLFLKSGLNLPKANDMPEEAKEASHQLFALSNKLKIVEHYQSRKDPKTGLYPCCKNQIVLDTLSLLRKYREKIKGEIAAAKIFSFDTETDQSDPKGVPDIFLVQALEGRQYVVRISRIAASYTLRETVDELGFLFAAIRSPKYVKFGSDIRSDLYELHKTLDRDLLCLVDAENVFSTSELLRWNVIQGLYTKEAVKLIGSKTGLGIIALLHLQKNHKVQFRQKFLKEGGTDSQLRKLSQWQQQEPGGGTKMYSWRKRVLSAEQLLYSYYDTAVVMKLAVDTLIGCLAKGTVQVDPETDFVTESFGPLFDKMFKAVFGDRYVSIYKDLDTWIAEQAEKPGPTTPSQETVVIEDEEMSQVLDFTDTTFNDDKKKLPTSDKKKTQDLRDVMNNKKKTPDLRSVMKSRGKTTDRQNPYYRQSPNKDNKQRRLSSNTGDKTEQRKRSGTKPYDRTSSTEQSHNRSDLEPPKASTSGTDRRHSNYRQSTPRWETPATTPKSNRQTRYQSVTSVRDALQLRKKIIGDLDPTTKTYEALPIEERYRSPLLNFKLVYTSQSWRHMRSARQLRVTQRQKYYKELLAQRSEPEWKLEQPIITRKRCFACGSKVHNWLSHSCQVSRYQQGEPVAPNLFVLYPCLCCGSVEHTTKMCEKLHSLCRTCGLRGHTTETHNEPEEVQKANERFQILKAVGKRTRKSQDDPHHRWGHDPNKDQKSTTLRSDTETEPDDLGIPEHFPKEKSLLGERPRKRRRRSRTPESQESRDRSRTPDRQRQGSRRSPTPTRGRKRATKSFKFPRPTDRRDGNDDSSTDEEFHRKRRYVTNYYYIQN